jgi:hypothetical protein
MLAGYIYSRGGKVLSMLTLRPTGLSPPVYRDQLDYEVIEDGRSIGRMYEDLHALPELRWFWSITVFVGYRPGVTTSGRFVFWKKGAANNFHRKKYRPCLTMWAKSVHK